MSEETTEMEPIKIPATVVVEPVPAAAPQPITDTKAVAVPTTTAEQNRHTESQRRINLIWELTQACIALSVIWGAVGVTVWLCVYDSMARSTAFTFLVSAVSTVIGFYFGRTNHQRIGGVDLGR